MHKPWTSFWPVKGKSIRFIEFEMYYNYRLIQIFLQILLLGNEMSNNAPWLILTDGTGNPNPVPNLFLIRCQSLVCRSYKPDWLQITQSRIKVKPDLVTIGLWSYSYCYVGQVSDILGVGFDFWRMKYFRGFVMNIWFDLNTYARFYQNSLTWR